MTKLRRPLALVLLLAMLLTLSPAVYADGAAELSDEELTAANEAVEIPDEEPAEPEEPAEGEDVGNGLDRSACGEEPEEPAEEAVELPYGLPGFGEGYALTEEQLAEKAALVEAGTAATLAGLTAGVDYEENIILVTAASEEEAAATAAAFGGTLVSFSVIFAKIELGMCTVAEAVAASADPALPLPAAWPSYISKLPELPAQTEEENQAAEQDLYTWFDTADWSYWAREALADPDIFITDPGAYDYPYQWQHDMVNSYEAWGVTTGREAVKVAVIDTGVDRNHEELSGKVTRYDIGNGFEDIDGHGTHVAGIIAANLGNGAGGAGIAPGVSIISIRVSDDRGYISDADIASAIIGAVDKGAWIINMSLGGVYENYQIQQAINYAYSRNVTVITAMGNDGTNLKSYPAAFDHTIAVAAVDKDGKRASFSTFGDWADVAAPGVGIVSCVSGSDECSIGWKAGSSGYYWYMDGTSQATPIVSGLCALYMSAVGRVSPDEMLKVLKKTCKKTDSGIGAGVVDAAKMFTADKDMPDYYISGSGNDKDGYSSDSVLYLYDTLYDDSGSFNDYCHGIIYTLDGKNPVYKDGETLNADEYFGPIELYPFAGTTVTVKAARVTGLGVMGKVRTIKIKVKPVTTISGISLVAPDEVIAGKTIPLQAIVYPLDADQSVTWAVSGVPGVKIDKTGKLTVPKNCYGTIEVIVRSAVDPSKSASAPIRVTNPAPTAKIVLKNSKFNAYIGYVFDAAQLFSYAVDTNGDPCNPPITWKSSNEKVIRVADDGWFIAVGKGSATLTATAQDGSGKTAKCTVTVNKAVESVYVTGQDVVAPGASATYKAEVYPSDASNKKVQWSLAGSYSGVTVNPTSGKLTVDKYAPTGQTVKLRCVALGADPDVPVETVFIVTIKNKVSYVKLALKDSGRNAYDRVTYKNGLLNTIKLFNVDLQDSFWNSNYPYDDSCIELSSYSDVGTYVTYTSSNTKVARCDGGTVYAVGKGTATITCKAMDGSGKSAKVTVKVEIPASDMYIRSSIPISGFDTPIVCVGKSAKNTVTFSDTYGVPTNKKVEWELRVWRYNSLEDYNSGGGYEVTTYCKNNKYVTLSTAGVLSVSSAAKSYVENIAYYDGVLEAYVTARATDGSLESVTQVYYIMPAATKLSTGYKTYYLPRYSDIYYYDCAIFCDAERVFGLPYGINFTATSSNPDVVGIIQDAIVRDENWYYYYDMYLAPGVNAKPGQSATITITLNDGSNKKCSFKVVIQ